MYYNLITIPYEALFRAKTQLLNNNSSSLNKRNHNRDGFWISYLNEEIFYDFIFHFFLSFSFDWEETSNIHDCFYHITKHFEVRQKCSVARLFFFHSFLGVWKCGKTLSLMFDK